MYHFKKSTGPICLKFWHNAGIGERDAEPKFQDASSNKNVNFAYDQFYPNFQICYIKFVHHSKKTAPPICLKFWDIAGIDKVEAHPEFEACSSSNGC